MTKVSFKVKLIALLAVIACAVAMTVAITVSNADADENEDLGDLFEPIAEPTVITEFTYAEGVENVALDVQESDPYYVLIGDTKATDAGSYSFTLAARAGYYFEAETLLGFEIYRTYEWTVNQQGVDVPLQACALTYNGADQEANIIASDKCSVYEPFHGELSPYQSVLTAKDAGTYTIYYALNDYDNYKWNTEEGQDAVEWTEPIAVTWTINQIMLAGQGAAFTKGSAEGVQVECNGVRGELVGLLINGEPLDINALPEGVTLDENKSILSHSAAFLNALSVGEYAITFVYDNADGNYYVEQQGEESAEDVADLATFTTTLTVKDGVAKTGDSALPIAIALALVVAAGAVLVLRRQRD